MKIRDVSGSLLCDLPLNALRGSQLRSANLSGISKIQTGALAGASASMLFVDWTVLTSKIFHWPWALLGCSLVALILMWLPYKVRTIASLTCLTTVGIVTAVFASRFSGLVFDLIAAVLCVAYVTVLLLTAGKIHTLGIYGRDLSNVDFSHADLSEASLGRIMIANANFKNAKLCGCDLRYANACGADFSGADVSNARFDDANLRNAVFKGSNINGATFHRANLEGAYFDGNDPGIVV